MGLFATEVFKWYFMVSSPMGSYKFNFDATIRDDGSFLAVVAEIGKVEFYIAWTGCETPISIQWAECKAAMLVVSEASRLTSTIFCVKGIPSSQ